MKRALLSALSLSALLWTPALATAQTAEPAVDESDTVVVTAARREQNVQDVPIAVSALSEELLLSTGTSTIAQITQLQPTVQFISSN